MFVTHLFMFATFVLKPWNLFVRMLSCWFPAKL